MPSDELQDLIDSLLVQACPGWASPPRVTSADDEAGQHRRSRIEQTRFRLGQALAGQPDLTARLSAEILRAILLEDSLTDQLTGPLIAAVGRRSVLEQLIEAVTEGPCQRRANAAGAAYWVRCWQHPGTSTLLRSAYAQGARDPAEFRGYLASQLPPRPAGIDRIDDLWPRFWRACLTAFVACEDAEVRGLLQTAFPGDASCYPPECAPMLGRAQQIAAADPQRFQRMLDGTTGFGYRI